MSIDSMALAKARVFSIGPKDPSALIAETQSATGLARIIYALDASGLDHSGAFAFFSPDASITRNKARWAAGYGYGCLVRFQRPEHDEPVFFPEIRPNACGMIAFKLLDGLPEISELSERMDQLEKDGAIDGIPLRLNLGNSNHFIEVSRVRVASDPALKVDDVVGIIHTSPSELKHGLYDQEVLIRSGGKYVPTPHGEILMLRGHSARDYIARYQEIDNFSIRRRESIATTLFGNIETLGNHNHQGIFLDGSIRLGLYDTSSGNSIYPVTLRWDVPVRLYKPRRNINSALLPEQVVEGLNSAGVSPEDLNILPHGGGYQLHESLKYEGPGKIAGKVVHFTSSNGAKYMFSDPTELTYQYRTHGIYEGIESYQLGTDIAELHQIFTLKY